MADCFTLEESIIKAQDFLEKLFTLEDEKSVISHSKRVALLAKKFAIYLEMEELVQTKLYLAGLIHDLGKYSIQIWKKDGAFTTKEKEKMNGHSQESVNLAYEKITTNFDVMMAIRDSHRFVSGNGGYPRLLREMTEMAQILSICDAYDAMTHRRTYQPIKTKIQALQELNDKQGTQFDPVMVQKFIEFNNASFDGA